MTLGTFENNPNDVGWGQGLPSVDQAILEEIENSNAIADLKIVSSIFDSIDID